jgi:hypothetical protein
MPATLLSVPVELRLKIYGFLMVLDEPVTDNSKTANTISTDDAQID